MNRVEGTNILLDRHPFNSSPKTLPVSVELVREHIQLYDTLDDGLLKGVSGFQGYILAATEEVENRGQVSLVSQRRRLVLGDFIGSVSNLAFLLPFGPVTSITEVKYLDESGAEQTLDPSKYRLTKTGGIVFSSTVPTVYSGPDTLWIDYQAGFGNGPDNVPASWQNCVMACASHKYNFRDGASGGSYDVAWEKAFSNMIRAAGRSMRYV